MKAQDLKNSVLQLAIQGKLVEQNPNDEPASVLLEKIKAEKEKLIKEKKIKRTKQLTEIDEIEKPFEIPDSWEWVRLEDIIYSIGSKQNQIKQTQILENGKYPVVSQSINIIEGYSNEIEKVLEIPSSVIVFGDHSRTIKFIDFNFIIGADGTKILVPVKVYGKYLYYVLKYNVINIKDRGYSRHYQFLKEKLVPLPPLEEEKRIVAKIEEVFEKIEEYDNAEKELSELEKTFPQDMKKSILQYAIQGKLVEQNPNDESASVLLEKIKAEKEKLIKEKKIKMEKPLPEISEEEKRYELPNGWQWVRISDVAQINPRNKIDDNLETSFIPMKLIEDGYSNFHAMESRKWEEIKSGFTHFEEYDVVLAKITPCFQNRKSAIMKNLINGAGAGTTELYVLRPYGKYVLSEFLLYLVKSHDFIEGGVRTYTGTAGQQRVKKEFVENYVFALPPIEEQRRIVFELDRAFEFINKLENKINNKDLLNRIVQAKTIEVEDKKVLINN